MCATSKGTMMKTAIMIALISANCATQVFAEEAQVVETRTEGTPVIDHSVTAMMADGEMMTFTVVSVPTTVTYTRVAGDPLTVASSVSLEPNAYLCDGPEMRNQSAVVNEDRIIFSYDCIRSEK